MEPPSIDERLEHLEKKLDKLLDIYERFAPLLDKLADGKGLVGRMVGRAPNTTPTFGKVKHGN